MEFQLIYLKILKVDAVKVLHSMSANLENSAVATELEKFSFQNQRKAMPKNVQTAVQLLSFYMLARLCLKSFKLGFSSKFSKPGFKSTWTMNFQMFKLDLEMAEEPEIKLPISTGSMKKQASSRTISTSDLLTMPKPLIVWTTTNYGKFLKRWEYQTTWLLPLKSVCRSRSNS